MLLFPLIFAVSCFAAVCGVLLASLLVDRFRTITKYAYNSRHNVTIRLIILFFRKKRHCPSRHCPSTTTPVGIVGQGWVEVGYGFRLEQIGNKCRNNCQSE